jgi:hypothetical protein
MCCVGDEKLSLAWVRNLVSSPQGRNEMEDTPQQYIYGVTLIPKMGEVTKRMNICTAQSDESSANLLRVKAEMNGGHGTSGRSNEFILSLKNFWKDMRIII